MVSYSVFHIKQKIEFEKFNCFFVDFLRNNFYNINGDSNNRPAFVFKTSKFLLNLACRLDRHAGDYLSTEWVFFDGSQKV